VATTIATHTRAYE